MDPLSLGVDMLLLSISVILIILSFMVIKAMRSRGVKSTFIFPMLIVGILYIVATVTELLEDFWGPMKEIHSISMILIVILLTYGVYDYYKMVKKI